MGLTLRCRRYIFLAGSLHLELVHCFTCLGNVDLVVALHTNLSPFVVFRKAQALSGGNRLFFPQTYLFPERKSHACEWKPVRPVSDKKCIALFRAVQPPKTVTPSPVCTPESHLSSCWSRFTHLTSPAYWAISARSPIPKWNRSIPHWNAVLNYDKPAGQKLSAQLYT